MDKEIKEGDLVYLKSGGPTMTVEKVEGSPPFTELECIWFQNGKFERAKFLRIVLTIGATAKGAY